jgi:hypothetical protein
MLTMRPKPRAIMPSTVSRIIAMGPSIMSSRAASQSSRDQSLKSPGGRPCELLMRMSGCGQAEIAAARPSFVVRSAATMTVAAPVSCSISPPALSSPSRLRATMMMLTPSRAADQRTFAAYAEVHVCSVKRRGNSGGDGSDRLELVAVGLVQLEIGDDAKTFSECVRV